MRNLFTQRHPFLMQALGGLIAVIVFIPIAVWVFFAVTTAKAPATAATVYAPPSLAGQTNGPSPNGQNGSKGSSNGGVSKNGGTSPSAGATTCSTKTCIVKEQPGQGLYVFAPANLSIKVGTTVKWVDVNSVPHNIIGTNNTFINKQTPDANSYTLTFTKKGVYNYNCTLHLPIMVGKIIVQ
jgi:plastocyanin